VRKSHYALEKLTGGNRLTSAFNRPVFKEFVLRDKTGRVDELLAEALDRGYFAGVPLGQWYPDLADCLLVCVTEKRSREEIDGLAEIVKEGKKQKSPRKHGAAVADR
jgi:glycine dehydrogenase subunit 1